MASTGSVRAGSAYVEAYLDDSKFNRGLRQLQSRTSGIARTLALAGGGGIAGGLAISGPIDASVQAASNAFETFDRFRLVFGPLTQEADDFAKTLSNKVNRSVVDTRKQMASFFSFFRGVGFDPSGALALSKAMQQLALDFASINNIADEEGFGRFIAALSGSSEVLDQFGIIIKQDALELELLSLGFQGTFQDATEAQKAMARVSIIARELGKSGAIGNAVTTAYSYANSLKGLQGALKDLQIAIGLPLLPLRAEWNQRISGAVKVLTDFVTANQQAVVTLATTGSVVLAVGGGLLATAGVIVGTSLAFGLLGKSASLLVSPFTAAAGAVYNLGTAAISTAAAASVAATRSVLGVASTTVGIVGSSVAGIASLVVSSIASLGSLGASAVGALAQRVGGLLVPSLRLAAGAMTEGFARGARVAVLSSGQLLQGVGTLASQMGGLLPAAVGNSIGAIGQWVSTLALSSGPVGAWVFGIVGAAAAIGTAMVVVSDSAARVAAALADNFTRMVDIAGVAAGGIYNALISGNWSKAIEIAGAAMNAAWQTLLYGMANLGVSIFGEDVTNVFINMGKAIVAAFDFLGPYVLGILKGIGRFVKNTLGFAARLANKLFSALGFSTDLGEELDNLKDKSDKAITNLKRASEAKNTPEGDGEKKKPGEKKEDDEKKPEKDVKDGADKLAEAAKAALGDIKTRINVDPESLKKMEEQARKALEEAQSFDPSSILQDPRLKQFQDSANQFQQKAPGFLGITKGGFNLPGLDSIKEAGKGIFDALFPAKNEKLDEAKKNLENAQKGQGIDFASLFAQAGIGGGGKGKGESRTFGTFSAFAASAQRGVAPTNELRNLRTNAERHRKTAEKQLDETKRTNSHLTKTQVA